MYHKRHREGFICLILLPTKRPDRSELVTHIVLTGSGELDVRISWGLVQFISCWSRSLHVIRKIPFQTLLSRSLLSLTSLDIGALGLDDSHLQAPWEGRNIGTCLDSSSQNERGISGMNKKLFFQNMTPSRILINCFGLSTEEAYLFLSTMLGVKEGGIR